MTRQKPDYTQLKALLENESFPYEHVFKFVGRNTAAFDAGVTALEAAVGKLRRQSSRLSAANAQGVQAHRSVTYVLEVTSADEVIAVLRIIDTIDDLLIVL